MDYEHIAASGIYYLSVSDNISNNHLSFRTLIDEDDVSDSGRYPGEEISLVNNLGKVPTPTGRALVWENSFQHQVGFLKVPQTSPKTGIRKILCFFLVDPDIRIISTKIVSPQQNLIPIEIAMEHRQKLMNQRKYKASRDEVEWEHRTYTFCEH